MTLNSINKQPIQKMGRRPEQTFLQRGHIDGQQAHEKIFNITSYQRSASQNYNEISMRYQSEQLSSKNPQTTNAGEGVERREPFYTVGGDVNWYNPYAEQYGDSLKK